jgi:hypothetical protein
LADLTTFGKLFMAVSRLTLVTPVDLEKVQKQNRLPDDLNNLSY